MSSAVARVKTAERAKTYRQRQRQHMIVLAVEVNESLLVEQLKVGGFLPPFFTPSNLTVQERAEAARATAKLLDEVLHADRVTEELKP